MHRLLSSAGLWPTLVSILALFVHPLLFCLFSFLLHLFLLLPVDSCLSIYLFGDGKTSGIVYTHSSPVLPVFLLSPPRCLLPVCVFSLSFSSSDHPASTPDSSFPSHSVFQHVCHLPGLKHPQSFCHGVLGWFSMLVSFFQPKAPNLWKMPICAVTPLSVHWLPNPTPEQWAAEQP